LIRSEIAPFLFNDLHVIRLSSINGTSKRRYGASKDIIYHTKVGDLKPYLHYTKTLTLRYWRVDDKPRIRANFQELCSVLSPNQLTTITLTEDSRLDANSFATLDRLAASQAGSLKVLHIPSWDTADSGFQANRENYVTDIAAVLSDQKGHTTYVYPRAHLPIIARAAGASAANHRPVTHQPGLVLFGVGPEGKTARQYKGMHRALGFQVPLMVTHLRLIGMDLSMVGRHLCLAYMESLYLEDCWNDGPFLTWLASTSSTNVSQHPRNLRKFSHTTLRTKTMVSDEKLRLILEALPGLKTLSLH
jgi:hypothetical protein